jgi:DNA (cytosine-5)-methyltransferase 1
MPSSLIVDLFAGGGGASLGIEAATGRNVSIAVNHDPIALAVHRQNHPRTLHLTADIWDVKPREAVGALPVDLLWASPDCRHHSKAKGGKPRSQGIRSLAWVVIRWARDVRPNVIFLENVEEFRDWGPLGEDNLPIKEKRGQTFQRWLKQLENLGYVVDYRLLNAAHYGAPTSRKRLFLVARRDGQRIQWPAPTHGGLGLAPMRSAAEVIDWSLPAPSIFERARPLADATLRRIAAGIKRYVLNNPRPFIAPVGGSLAAPTLIQTSYGEREGQRPRCLDIQQPLGTVVAGGQKHALVAAFLAKHYGGVVGLPMSAPLGTITTQDHHALGTVTLGQGGRAREVRAFLTAYYSAKGDAGQSLTDPLRTVTTKDRLGLVTVAGEDYQITDIGMRMLAPHELLAAQFGGFATGYSLEAAPTQGDKIRLIGNSVCPEVAEAVVRANVAREALAEAAE